LKTSEEMMGRTCGCHEAAAATGLPLRPGGLSLTDRAMELCRFHRDAWIADIGCGPLRTVQHLRSRYGVNAFGLDPSESLVTLGLLGMPGPFAVRGLAEALPFSANSLDGLFSECVLSVVAGFDEALREFRRVLKPGGALIISDIFTKEVPSGPASSLRTRGGYIGPLLENLHFSVELLEDHTRSLKTFAARWVLSHGFLPCFWARKYLGPEMGGHCLGAAKVGYFLLIARKSMQ
jgi:arsenite methyltransferase